MEMEIDMPRQKFRAISSRFFFQYVFTRTGAVPSPRLHLARLTKRPKRGRIRS
jgi:hypothetical protein